mgnify:CR=1 FL=1
MNKNFLRKIYTTGIVSNFVNLLGKPWRGNGSILMYHRVLPDERINEDLAEAKKFGFQGTPGFLINGIPVKGAYPASHFEEIVKELVKRGKLKL